MRRKARPTGTGCSPGGAFTLVELLVVISIIALLIAILLPSLSKVRKQSQAVVCLHRCRQLGVGMTMYVSEYDVYPPHQLFLDQIDPETNKKKRVRWFNAMAYLLNTDEKDTYKVQSCPSVHNWSVGRNNSYGYNYKYIGSYRRNENAKNPYAPYERFPVKCVRCPSKTIAFADCDGTGWKHEHRNDFEEDYKNPERLGNHGYILDPTYIPLWSNDTWSGPPDDLEQESYAWKNWRSYLSDRHLQRSAAVFTDGHGEMVDPRVAYRDNSMWNGVGQDPGLLDNGQQDLDHSLYSLDPHVDYKWDASSGQEWRYGAVAK